MKEKKSFKLVVIADIEPHLSAKSAANLSSFFYLLSSCKQISHLNWAMSATFLNNSISGRKKSFIPDLRNRIKKSDDSVILKGYSGSFHSLLLRHELEKEIEWGLSNPWNTGIGDLLKTYPSAFLCEDMDIYRKEALAMYEDSPFIWLIPPPISKTLSPVRVIQKEKTVLFPALWLSEGNKSELFTRLKKIYRKESSIIFLFFNPSVEKGPEIIRVLDEVIRQFKEKNWEISLTEAGSNFSDYPHKEQTPAFRNKIPHTPLYRMHRKEKFSRHDRLALKMDDALLSSFLHSLGEICVPAPFPPIQSAESLPKPARQNLIANMSGLISIAEGDIEAIFSNGRLQALLSSRQKVTCDRPAVSYITIANKKEVFTTSASFSFENKNLRGLREIQTLSLPAPVGHIKPDAEIITDYFFFEDLPTLLVSVYIRYPEIPGNIAISAYAPLEIPLFILKKGEVVTTTGVYPDGSSYSTEMQSAEDDFLFPGKKFIFSSGENHFSLSFSVPDSNETELLPAKIIKEGNNFLLLINPMGSYTGIQSDEIANFSEHFSLCLSASTGNLPAAEPDFCLDSQKFFEKSWIYQNFPQKKSLGRIGK